MSAPPWVVSEADDPIIATAIHAGHTLRPELLALSALSDEERLREEDPHTDRWLGLAANQIAVDTSRFETDLNRPRASAFYVEPEDAWGLTLWKSRPAEEVITRSRLLYEDFYRDLGELCDKTAAANGRFVLLDLHSYNHRRGGHDAPVDDPEQNPEINVGTGSLDRGNWSDVAEVFSTAVAESPFDGGHLDVRENVRFQGGWMSRWINDRYAGRGCALAIEVKKIYMDEWTGEADESVIANVGDALRAGAMAVREVLSS